MNIQKLQYFQKKVKRNSSYLKCQIVRKAGGRGDILAAGGDCYGWVCGHAYMKHFFIKIKYSIFQIFDKSNIILRGILAGNLRGYTLNKTHKPPNSGENKQHNILRSNYCIRVVMNTKRKRLILFILLSVIVAGAPVTNGRVDVNLIKGIVWRLTMVICFVIGVEWNRKNKVNKNLTEKLA